jgi:hypothetical protein
MGDRIKTDPPTRPRCIARSPCTNSADGVKQRYKDSAGSSFEQIMGLNCADSKSIT